MVGVRAALLLLWVGVAAGAYSYQFCSTFVDEDGADIRHTDERRSPCTDGLGTPCAYTLNLPFANGTTAYSMQVDGCCVEERYPSEVKDQFGGVQYLIKMPYCASPRSKEAAAVGSIVKAHLRLENVCRGGTVHVVPLLSAEATAANACPAPLPGNAGDTSPICDVGNLNGRDCMCYNQFGIPHASKICRCKHANTDAKCEGQANDFCTGSIGSSGLSDGMCTAISHLAEGFQTAGYTPSHFRSVQQTDGSSVRRSKETAWFGDEQIDVQPPATPSWAHQAIEGDEASWVAFDEFNSLVLEESHSEKRASAVVDLADFSRGSLFVNFADMVLYFSTGVTHKVRRIAPVGSVIEQKLSVKDAATLKDLHEAQRAVLN
mmetsp:Transcript_67452/g.160963  ORF Transcript_67452/g.160963 Transcript_67452/m.160963 type:complete len:376 (+) Transcript_67452:164-1291(+)